LSSFASENTAESNAGEHPLATLAFGRAEAGEVYARLSEEPFIVAARQGLLDAIFSDPLQWQEVAVFKFKPEEVHRLDVTVERETNLKRGPDASWVRAQGSEPINQVNVQSLLNTLTKLRAVRWLGDQTPPQAFDKILTTVVFTTSADDKTSHKLVVGGPAGEGMWYARVEGRPGIFVLSNPDFNALRLPLDENSTPTATNAPAASASPATPTPKP